MSTRESSREDAIAQGQGNFVENAAARRQGINQYHSQGDVTRRHPRRHRKKKKKGGPDSSSKQTPAWEREREKTSTLTIIKRSGGVGWGSPVNQVAPSGGLVGGAPTT